MSVISVIVVVFSIAAAIDRITGGKMGLAKEFEKGFMLLGIMALSMIGMIIISPYLAEVLRPVFVFVYDVFGIDPSVIPASLFANDMGGAPLAKEVAVNKDVGMFNALVVSSMMGCTISFTIPVALEVVKKEHHREVLLGLLCGIATIPVGCFAGGLISGLDILLLIKTLLPLILFSGIIATGLMLFPDVCVKIFGVLGLVIKILITIGLALGIVRYLVGIEIIKGLETIEEGARICFNASIVMSGAFPFMKIVSIVLSKPMNKLGKKLGINEVSAIGFVSSAATSMTTFEMMDRMDKKGIILNSAFAVSAAFVFAGHLAFTMAFDSSCIPAMMTGKLVAGICSVGLAILIYIRIYGRESNV